MGKLKLSIQGLDPDKTAIAHGRDLRVSYKHAREICAELKGKYIEEAQEYLDEVIQMKRAVPFRRYRLKVGHRKGLNKWPSGRYPVKAAHHIRKVIDNAENNAVFKGLDTSRLRIKRILAQKGAKTKGAMPRAQGRSSPKVMTLVMIECVVEEES
ncbi:MAG: 50S ribosomal protein L22 [Promethearchaeota archaeon]